MEKKEFLSICDSTLKEMGFSKKGGAYYLNIGSDLVGAVFFRKSNFGSVYYVECGIAIQGYNETFPFPKYYDVDISTRFQFPLKVHLQYDPSATHGYSVDLERNTETEIKEGIKKALRDGCYLRCMEVNSIFLTTGKSIAFITQARWYILHLNNGAYLVNYLLSRITDKK